MKITRIMRKTVLACIIAGALALVGCGGSSSTAPAASTVTTTGAATSAGTSAVITTTTPDAVATVTIPQSTLLTDSNGAPVTGNLTITTTAITAASQLTSGTLAATLSDGSGLVLDKIGAIADISISNGTSTVKTFGTPITVNLKLPTSYTVGSSVDYYSFDGVSTWKKEGTAVVKADHSIDMVVTHLSQWGAGSFGLPANNLISYIGSVKSWNPAAAINGVSISTTLLNSAITATTDSNGRFTLASIPANTSFGIKFSQNGYVDLYSARYSLANSFDASARNYSMMTSAQMTSYGNTPGNGLIGSNVSTQDGTYIAGAVVTAADAQNGASYTVKYRDSNGSFIVNATSTDSSGRWMIVNVPAGRTVNVTAAKSGYTFNTRVFDVYANAVSQTRIIGSVTNSGIEGIYHITLDSGGQPSMKVSATGVISDLTDATLTGVVNLETGEFTATSTGSGTTTTIRGTITISTGAVSGTYASSNRSGTFIGTKQAGSIAGTYAGTASGSGTPGTWNVTVTSGGALTGQDNNGAAITGTANTTTGAFTMTTAGVPANGNTPIYSTGTINLSTGTITGTWTLTVNGTVYNGTISGARQ